jgi:3-oxoacyl-[acyl-carrier protein] reductase
MAKGVPVGALGQPKDIAALVVYLASNEASWMTGQTLELNGGSVTT